ncbi:ABC transporter substrate-binding protein [Frankia tisae]|uniref:ABC transporter substrate-binding protein n=1 Tax=Frankia tisae TaxID=2950104 RepID=UPI0021BE44EC|nr:ABC transporter substrate-binding protein [Frankia tisae]
MIKKRSRRLGALATALAFSAAIVTACGSGGSSSAAAAPAAGGKIDLSGVTIRLGDQATLSTVHVLEGAGVLNDLPYKITSARFASANDELTAEQAGSLDIAGVGSTGLIYAAKAQSAVKFVAISALSSKGTGAGILVPKNSTLTSVRDLRGKRVAAPSGTLPQAFLLYELKQNGMTTKDIKIATLTYADSLTALAGGSVDAIAESQPYTQTGINKYGFKELVTAEQAGFPFIGGLAVPDSALRNPARSAAIGDLLVRWQKANTFYQQHPDRYAAVWAKDTGSPAAQAPPAPGDYLRIDSKITSALNQQLSLLVWGGVVPDKPRPDLGRYLDGRYNDRLFPTSTATPSAGPTAAGS